MKNDVLKDLELLVRSRHGLVYLETDEETSKSSPSGSSESLQEAKP